VTSGFRGGNQLALLLSDSAALCHAANTTPPFLKCCRSIFQATSLELFPVPPGTVDTKPTVLILKMKNAFGRKNNIRAQKETYRTPCVAISSSQGDRNEHNNQSDKLIHFFLRVRFNHQSDEGYFENQSKDFSLNLTPQ
jgi:hypothetical protein